MYTYEKFQLHIIFREKFSEAFEFWSWQIKLSNEDYGLFCLLEYLIRKYHEHPGICRDRIGKIY